MSSRAAFYSSSALVASSASLLASSIASELSCSSSSRFFSSLALCRSSSPSGIVPPNFSSSYSNTPIYSLHVSTSFSEASKSFLSSGMVYSRLTLALFLTDRARLPNRQVESVSWSLNGWGEHVITRQVLELPPSDSESILVSFESR